MIEKLKNIFLTKPIFPLAGVFLLLLSISLGVYLVKQKTQLRSKAASDTAILSFMPLSASAGLSQEVSFNVSFNRGTGSRPAVITGVDLRISPDNSNVQIESFTPDTAASKFNMELSNERAPDGSWLRYTAINTSDTASLPTSQVVSLGTLVVQTMATGSSTIRFDTAQTVASGYKDAVPLELRTAVITIEGSSLPSPTPPTACINGDTIGGDGLVDINDYNIWYAEFTGAKSTKTADFYPECRDGRKGDGVIDIRDYNIWRREMDKLR